MFSFFSKDISILTDCHFHAADCLKFNASLYSDLFSENAELTVKGCSCAHTKDEWEKQTSYIKEIAGNNSGVKIISSYGIHPLYAESQQYITENAAFLENLLKLKQVSAVGEAGFDFFTKELKEKKELQKSAFEICLTLAENFNVPLVIHCRKGIENLMAYKDSLKKIRAVVFHSYSGTAIQAEYFIKNRVNAYFSYGRVLLQNPVKYVETLKKIPLERLLLETDAPFMCKKNEVYSLPSSIVQVYEKTSEILEIKTGVLAEKCSRNFDRVFTDLQK